jgi:site-specific DNA-methyltransferase (adenine-specific)
MDELVHLFSSHGDTVCDPLMGSGTTGMACLRGGRNFIGVEKNPRYFELACRRIEAAHAQLRLFA